MSTRYLPILQAITERLGEINPDRLVTREWKDFALRQDPDLRRGVWMVLFGGITRYPYETSDNGMDTDVLRASENGRVRISIVGQVLLDAGATGLDVEEAEFVLIHELEQLADEAMATEPLQALVLQSVVNSQQIETPYAWVVSTWEVFEVN